MILRWGICLAILAAPPLGASTLDVSSETSIVVHAGETLIFQLLTGSFGVNAALEDQSPYPTDVNFALVSAPLSEAAWFAASVESADGTMSFALDNLTFGLGNLQSSGYTGAVSVLQGALHLSSLLDSARLFSGSSVVVTLLRSEKHTSELQSPCNLVCRLLLEKRPHSSPAPAPHCPARSSASPWSAAASDAPLNSCTNNAPTTSFL